MEKIRLKKSIAAGIILLFLGISLAPSINQNVVKASIDNISLENEKNNSPQLPLKKINNCQSRILVNNLIGLFDKRHPILLRIIEKFNDLRFSVYWLLYDFSTKIIYHNDPFPRIIHPIVFFLAWILFIRIQIGKNFWFDISQLFHWNWTYQDILGSP